MSLILNSDILDLYKKLPKLRFEIKKDNVLDMPTDILMKIVGYIKNTNDYKNLRATCKTMYFICENIIKFNQSGEKISELFISQGNAYKLEKYTTLFSYLNNHSIYFKSKVITIKNWTKHGIEIEFDHKKRVKKRTQYKFGKKCGVREEFIDNRLIKKTGYLDNYKHGISLIYFNNYTIKIERNYLVDILYKYKKYLKNSIMIDANFKGNILSGKTIIYSEIDTLDLNENYIKNILYFKNDNLIGKAIINQFDRILKLNYHEGKLNGRQMVFNIDNKLRFIGEYQNGHLEGKYVLFNNYKQIEEGYFLKGLFHKYITTVNTSEFSKITYPLNNGILHGEYIERINFVEVKLKYRYGIFDGFVSKLYKIFSIIFVG